MLFNIYNQKYHIITQKKLSVVFLLYFFIVNSSYTNYRLKKNKLELLLNTEYRHTVLKCKGLIQFYNSIKTENATLNISKIKHYSYLVDDKNKILRSLRSMSKSYPFISSFMQKFFSVNRLNLLRSNLYVDNFEKKLMLVNRQVVNYKNKNLVTHISKYLKKRETVKLSSYWQYPIRVDYNTAEKTYFINYRNSFNRVLVNNLINLFCSSYLRIFFNIFRHFNRLISKKIMSFYLHDYNFFKLFTKKKYTKFTLQWFKRFNTDRAGRTIENSRSNKFFYLTNYLRPTMFKTSQKKKLIQLVKKNQTYNYGWLFIFSLQEILKKLDSKILFFIRFVYLMRTQQYKRIWQRSKPLFINSPIKGKKFYIEFVNIFCISLYTKDPKFIFDFLFKHFNEMHFKLQFKFVSFIKSFIKYNFSFFKEFYSIRGLRIIVKGKIGKTGSVRKKKLILTAGSYCYSNLRLRMDEFVGPMFTPTGVIGARVIITY